MISKDTEEIRRHPKTNANDFCINDSSRIDNTIVHINKDIRRQEIEKSIREQNCTQILEYSPAIVGNEQQKDGGNIFFHVNEKNLSSAKIQEKMCQQTTKSGIQDDYPLVSTGISTTPNLSSDTIVTSDEQILADNTGLASQLRS